LWPQAHRVAIRRDSGEATLPWGFVLPAGEDLLTARVGRVLATGRGLRVNDEWLPLDIYIGDRVIYSARTDTFRTGDGGEFTEGVAHIL